jgi:hypothetical protein
VQIATIGRGVCGSADGCLDDEDPAVPLGFVAVTDADKELYAPPTEPVLVDVPAFDFLMIDGSGAPGADEHTAAVQALYSVSYPVVIGLKRAGRPELKVRPLEGMWWLADENYEGFDPRTSDRSTWRWTMLIRQPDDVPAGMFDAAIAKAVGKVGSDVAGRLRVERFDEGRSAQVLHRGPYADEFPTIARLHEFIAAQGLTERGRHHEIYLTDPRRSAPDRMRTVLRQPVT